MRFKAFHGRVDRLTIAFELPALGLADAEPLIELGGTNGLVLSIRSAPDNTVQFVQLKSGISVSKTQSNAIVGKRTELHIGPSEIVLIGDRRLEFQNHTVVPTDLAFLRHSEKIPLHCDAFDLGFAWRNFRYDSGFPCRHYFGSQLEKCELRPGLSFLIRAKNESANVTRCLDTLAPYRDEVIFVDNASTDDTYQKAHDAQRRYFNLKLFRYPLDIPRVGAEHARAVLEGSPNTLGDYYNFCLSKSSRFNFTKWDADYIALKSNLEEMTQLHMLRTRGDNFSLWFSGLELFVGGGRYWLDRRSRHSEWRAFSKLRGQKWTNLLPWEEVEQSYIYASNKAAYLKPVYVELFELDDREFVDRGSYLGDLRDSERLRFIEEYKATGALSDARFEELDGLDLDYLARQPLSEVEVGRSHEKMRNFAQIPQIRFGGQEIVPRFTTDQVHPVVLVVTCEKRRHRKHWIESTWVGDFSERAVPVYFVYGRPGRPSGIIGNEIHLDVEDNYENLVMKVCEAYRFLLDHVQFTHVIKIDDDVCLNVAQLDQIGLRDVDYTGGRLIHAGIRFDWHAGKCENDQLDNWPITPRKAQSWFDGGATYCLSRRAVEAVLARAPAIYSEMYEDQAVAAAVSDHPALRVADLPEYRGYKLTEKEVTGNLFYIGGIEDEARMRETHAAIRSRSAYGVECEANFDWMDFVAVANSLQVAECLTTASGKTAHIASLRMPTTITEIIVHDEYQHIAVDFEPIVVGVERFDHVKVGIFEGRLQLILPPTANRKSVTLTLGAPSDTHHSWLAKARGLTNGYAEPLAIFGRELPQLVTEARLAGGVTIELDRVFWIQTAAAVSKCLDRLAVSVEQASHGDALDLASDAKKLGQSVAATPSQPQIPQGIGDSVFDS